LLRQVEPGRFKVSLRSRGEVDVERLARRHGGGGHRNAAGFVLDGSADEVRALVVAALREALG
jgi:phosphoesterase RecJ-like protein